MLCRHLSGRYDFSPLPPYLATFLEIYYIVFNKIIHNIGTLRIQIVSTKIGIKVDNSYQKNEEVCRSKVHIKEYTKN